LEQNEISKSNPIVCGRKRDEFALGVRVEHRFEWNRFLSRLNVRVEHSIKLSKCLNLSSRCRKRDSCVKMITAFYSAPDKKIINVTEMRFFYYCI